MTVVYAHAVFQGQDQFAIVDNITHKMDTNALHAQKELLLTKEIPNVFN